MSKRFGRNQRRKMREQIASLKTSMEMDRALLLRQSRKIWEAEEYAKEVSALVGKFSIAAGEPQDNSMSVSGDFRAIPMRPIAALASFSNEPPKLEMIRDQTLRLLDVEAVRDRVSQYMHMRVRLKDGSAGYSISDMALCDLPTDVLERVIAPQLTRALVEAVKKVS